MLLAGGQGSRLYVLTENMAKPAVPFGGSGWNYNGTVKCERVASHGKEASIAVKIPPYGAVFFRGSGKLSAPRAARTQKADKAERPSGGRRARRPRRPRKL